MAGWDEPPGRDKKCNRTMAGTTAVTAQREPPGFNAPSMELSTHSSLLRLPRELRDQIYDFVFQLPDHRADRELRIERRNVRHFQPSAATILLILHHEDLLLNQQVATEALEVLLKHHTILLSCGPFVLKSLLYTIEQDKTGLGKKWLQWMNSIELDWVTFPNLRLYPPNRENGKDEWWWENDTYEIDVDYIRGAQYDGHYDEYDYEGEAYDDNLYAAEDDNLYPSYPTFSQPPDPADPFGLSTHYPFSDPQQQQEPEQEPGTGTAGSVEIETKLDMLVDMEVAPLFDYLATPTFALSSITIPLYFVSKQTYHSRNTSRPGFGLPLKLRYWTQVAVHALRLLYESPPDASPLLQEVRIRYMPWDIWAAMEPSDDLGKIVDKGVWFDDDEEGGTRTEGEGEAFRAVWRGLNGLGFACRDGTVSARVMLVKWEGDLQNQTPGDQLEVIFARTNDHDTPAGTVARCRTTPCT